MRDKRDKESFNELQKQKKRKMQSHEDRIRELENPAKSTYQASRTRKRSKKETSKTGQRVGLVLVALQAILSVVFVGTLITLNILPMKFMIVIIAVLALILGFTLFTQKRHKKKARPGKIVSIIMIILLGFGSFYIGKVNGAFDKVLSENYKIDNMVVAVLTDDAAESIQDAKDYNFGVQYQLGPSDVESVITGVNAELNTTIALTEYSDVQGQAEALLAQEVQAIIINEGYLDMIDEEVDDFSNSIKIIYVHEIRKELINAGTAADVEVESNTFNVYISGIDVYGDISKTSRSDVNIIATVNTETRQILLTTTPRDSYLTIPDVSGGQKDKLTHAGIYGVDASIATLENLYETTIPFYARVNFTSIIEMVDTLGGIEVYSEYAFTTKDGYAIQKGTNYLNGEQALSFARERKNVPGGDNQRGKNQQAVIVAMIKKMISPQILLKASSIIDSLSANVETNMSQSQMQDLIKMQLNEGGSWSIYSVAAEGKGTTNYTYSMPNRKLYVTELNTESIVKIMDLMDRVKAGEMIDGSEVAE